MAREPSYPKDAPVAPAKGAEAPPAPSAPEAGESKPADSKRTKHLMAGAAIGIGSAALVAALLYANRSRRDR
jgi:hypothetical protein